MRGRLGQRHADVLESMLFNAERMRQIPDGGVEMLVDPARVRRTLSPAGYSGQRLETLMDELISAVVDVKTSWLHITGHVIDHVARSQMTRPDPLTGNERPMWRVRLGIALVELLGNDLRLNRDPAPICNLSHGISQAVARHCLTHANPPRGGWFVDELVRVVAGRPASRKDCFNLRQDADGLSGIGLLLTPGRIKRAAGE